ncbi:hypothetical protein [Rhodopirellula halodulae]|uniref:hypothetical protein n=1 Tax=Rhodopirellula halodulae TaxID=2894198 RepID=UPI001E62908E|nr:hypothetical protein [Rhodopirellula sp. JC737]MCC9656707.1 hypothetical protein [Rhodopirellula sp. JC737]
MPELSASQRSSIRRMISDRRHPDTIDAYLVQRGFSDSDIANYYSESNLRRSHLLACYLMKRTVRLIGVALLAFSAAVPLFGGPLLVSITIVDYGIALIATGSLTVYEP